MKAREEGKHDRDHPTAMPRTPSVSGGRRGLEDREEYNIWYGPGMCSVVIA